MPRVATATTLAQCPAPAPQIRVKTVRTYGEFLNLEPVWNRVVKAAGHDNPFLEFSWARTWWDCFGEGSELNVMVAWAGDEALAIAPLILTSTRMMGVPVRRLGFFYNSHVPRADFIIANRAPEAYRAIREHLFSSQNWDVLQLCQVPTTSRSVREILGAAEHDGYPTGIWPSSDSPYVPLNGSWKDYMAGLAGKHRSNLRNRFKRLNAAGSVQAESVTTEPGLDDALQAGIQLEAAAWKGEQGTAISCSSSLQRFYSEFARRAAEQGWLRLNFLRAGDRRIAFDYSLEYNNHVFLLKQGYDPAYSAYSPSNLLLAMELEGLFGRQGARFDLLGDFAEWKRCWSRESSTHCWLYVFSKGPKGRWLHFVKFGLMPLAKRLMRKS
jgi:CelD/BcsL family acetyltransferase involved in cellulose biosynthesis